MEIDISEIIAAKKQEQRLRFIQNEKEFEVRRARRVAREAEEESLFESRFRRRAAEILDCLQGEHWPHKIEYWLLFDNWKVSDALLLLCGFDPRHWPCGADGQPLFPVIVDYASTESRALKFAKRLDGLPIYSEIFEDVVGEFRARTARSALELEFGRIKAVWDSGLHTEAQYPPQFFIDWARSKKRDVPWLAWAQEQGFCGAPQSEAKNKKTETGLSAKERNNYLRLTGALLQLYWEAANPGKNYENDFVQADVVSTLVEQFKGYPGMGLTHLDTTIRCARESLKM